MERKYYQRAQNIMRNIRRNTPPKLGRRMICVSAVSNFTTHLIALALSRRDNPQYNADQEQARLNEIKDVYKKYRTGDLSCVKAMTLLCAVFNR